MFYIGEYIMPIVLFTIHFLPLVLIIIYIVKSLKNKKLTIKFPAMISIYFILASLFCIYAMIDSIGKEAYHGDVTGRIFVIPLVIILVRAFVLWGFYSIYNIKINKNIKKKLFPLIIFLVCSLILGIYFYFLIKIVFN